MEQTERKKPRRALTWLWMLISLVAVGAFLYWLSVESEPTQVAVVEEEDPFAGETGALRVSPDTFAADPDSYVGGDVLLNGVRAQSTMGPQAYWLEMPNGVPYLAKADSSLLTAGEFDLEVGTAYSLVGTVHVMSDSVLTAWEETGAITEEGQRMQAEFATSFIEVRRVVPTRSGGGGESGE